MCHKLKYKISIWKGFERGCRMEIERVDGPPQRKAIGGKNNNKRSLF